MQIDVWQLSGGTTAGGETKIRRLHVRCNLLPSRVSNRCRGTCPGCAGRKVKEGVMNVRVPAIAVLMVMGMQMGVLADNRHQGEGSSAVIASDGDNLFWRIKLIFDNTRERECVRPPQPVQHVVVHPSRPAPRQEYRCCAHPGKAKGWHKRHICRHEREHAYQGWAWRR